MTLADKFELYTIDWQTKLQEDEWYFAKLREKLTSGLQPNEAFDTISEAVDLTLRQSNEFLCLECFELLLELSRIADTTEVQPALNEKWTQLCDHVSQFSDYHKRRVTELKRWYRRNSPSKDVAA